MPPTITTTTWNRDFSGLASKLRGEFGKLGALFETDKHSELAPELGLPPSGLSEFAYPDLFPSPPASLGRVQTEIEEGQPHSEERGWFFYLAEISLRRTIIDTIKVIYRKGETQWVNNIQWLVAQHDEQEQQVLLWYVSRLIHVSHANFKGNHTSPHQSNSHTPSSQKTNSHSSSKAASSNGDNTSLNPSSTTSCTSPSMKRPAHNSSPSPKAELTSARN